MYPWSKKKSSTERRSTNENSRDGMTAAAATATEQASPSSAPASSSSSTSAAASSSRLTTGNSSQTSSSQAHSRSLSPWELVERRLKSSTWGRRPILHPSSTGGTTMHELIDNIGSGASAGRILHRQSSSSVATDASTPTSAAAILEAVGEESSSSSPPLPLAQPSLPLSPTEAAWKEIEARCKSHAQEASHLDRRGRTCLHAACAKKPPLSVIHALLDALLQQTDDDDSIILEARDKHGRTPLLIAIAHNAGLSVILFLLQKCPKAASVSDHSGNLPLMLACQGYNTSCGSSQVELLVQHLLVSFPQAAQRESFNGRLALHMAVEGQASATVVAQLVQVYPQAVLHDGCGLNPLFLAIRFHASVDVIATLVQACPQATLTRDRGPGMPLRRALENQSPVAVQALLCTSPQVVLDADPHVHNTALHAALEYGGMPIKLATIQLLLRMAPQLATQRSRSGQTPLTLACRRWQGFHKSLQHLQSQHQALLEQQQQQQHQQQEQLLQQQENNPMAMDFVAAMSVGLVLDRPRSNNARERLANIHILEGHCQQVWQLLVPLIQAAFYGVIAADDDDDDAALLAAAAAALSSSSLNGPQQPQTQQQVHDHDNNGATTDNNNNNNEAAAQSAAASSPQQQQQQQQHPLQSLQQQPMRLHVLHAAVSLQLPLDVVFHALELHASDAKTRNDPSGRYPLQLCILSQPSHQQQHQQHHNDDKNLIFEKEQCILKTLQAYPEATQLPDVTGRLALHLAAQESTTVSIVVLQQLWTHNPAALATLDPLWRLYPFQIAAVDKQQTATADAGGSAAALARAANEQAGEWQQTQDLMQLSAVFVLLKELPDLIHLHL